MLTLARRAGQAFYIYRGKVVTKLTFEKTTDDGAMMLEMQTAAVSRQLPLHGNRPRPLLAPFENVTVQYMGENTHPDNPPGQYKFTFGAPADVRIDRAEVYGDKKYNPRRAAVPGDQPFHEKGVRS